MAIFREEQRHALIEQTILTQEEERDERDEKRATAPLKPAKDAIILDTSNYSAQQVFEKVCSIIDSL